MCDIIIDVLVRLWQNIMQFSLDSFRFLYFEVCAVNTTSEILSCSPNTSKTYQIELNLNFIFYLLVGYYFHAQYFYYFLTKGF